MDIKRILLVSSAFYPEISPRSFRATELAKELHRQGHNVTVVTKNRPFDYTSFLNEHPIVLKMWGEPIFKEIPETRLRFLSVLSKVTNRLLSILFEYPTIGEMFQVKRILSKEKDYDLMISFAVPFPVHWGVATVVNNHRKIADIWVADCGDPFMFARLDRFRKPFYFKYFEHSFCQKCDYISIPFRELEKQFYTHYQHKMRVIPQGFNFQEIRCYEGELEHARPIFMFSGSVIPGKRDLNNFFEFLASVHNDFLFIVYTNQPDYYERYAKCLKGKIEIRSYVDRLSLIYEMSKVHFLVNVDTIHDSQNNVEAIPSKLIDYALSGRPILNIKSSQLDTGLVAEFLDGNYERQRIIDKDKFDIIKVANKFLQLAT